MDIEQQELGGIEQLKSSILLNRRQTNYMRNGSLTLVQTYRQKHMYYSESGQEYSLLASPDQLASHGSGIVLYFKIYRVVITFLFVASLLSIAPIVLNTRKKDLSSLGLSVQSTLSKLTYLSLAGSYHEQMWSMMVYIFSYVAIWLTLLLTVLYLRHAINAQGSLQGRLKVEDYTLHVYMPGSQNVSTTKLATFFSHLAGGTPVNVVPVLDFRGDMLLIREIEHLELEIIKLSFNQVEDKDEKRNQLTEHRSKLLDKLSFRTNELQVMYLFATFQFKRVREDVFRRFQKQYLDTGTWHSLVVGCCSQEVPQELTFQGNKVLLEKEGIPAPQEINWQNLDTPLLSRICRTLLVVFLIILALTLSTLLTGVLYIYGKENESQCTSEVPTYDSAINSPDNSTTRVCYCLANIANIQQPALSFCKKMLSQLVVSYLIQAAVAIISAVTNQLYFVIVLVSASFMRFKYRDSVYSFKTILTFLSLFLNSGILPVLIAARIDGVAPAEGGIFILSLLNLNVYNINYHEDFDEYWYLQYSPYFISYILIDLAVPVLKLAIVGLRHCWVNSKIADMEGKASQLEMNMTALFYQFDVEIQFGEVLNVVYITLIYGTGIPLLYPLALFNLLVRYLVNAFLILRFSKKIYGLKEDYLARVVKMLHAALPLSIAIGSWMLTAMIGLQSLAVLNWINLTDNNYLFRFFFISILTILLFLSVAINLLDNTIVALIEGRCRPQMHPQDHPQQKLSDLVPHSDRLSVYDMVKNNEYIDIATFIQQQRHP